MEALPQVAEPPVGQTATLPTSRSSDAVHRRLMVPSAHPQSVSQALGPNLVRALSLGCGPLAVVMLDCEICDDQTWQLAAGSAALPSSIQLTSGALSQSLGRLRRRPNRSTRFAIDAPSNLLCFVFVEDRSCCEARENALGGHKLEPNVRAYLCAPDTASSRPLLSRIHSDEFSYSKLAT